MCLILFAYRVHARYRLVLLANRDEFYKRPTTPAGWWDQYPNLLAGKDLKARGTWMGVTKTGKFAAITNFRESLKQKKDALSRGKLVSNYLTGSASPSEYLESVKPNTALYNGFNFILGDTRQLYYFSNRDNPAGQVIQPLEPGIYGLSNASLDTPWPKVVKGKRLLQQLLDGQDVSVEKAYEILKDNTRASKTELPNTGVGAWFERMLSPMFIKIKTLGYGTRSSSVVLMDNENQVIFAEQSFIPPVENRWQFEINESR